MGYTGRIDITSLVGKGGISPLILSQPVQHLYSFIYGKTWGELKKSMNSMFGIMPKSSTDKELAQKLIIFAGRLF